MKTKIFKIWMLALCVGMVSCNDGDSVSLGGDKPLTNIVPTLDWGASKMEVTSKQKDDISLVSETDELLRYKSKKEDITLDYCFEDDKLIATSLTQANVSDIGNVAKNWCANYNQIANSETTILSVSEDKATLVYGKIIKGSECDYASIAWTYIDENEGLNDGIDYTPSGTENGYDYVDLGVGIGWAVQNVGASSPEQSGGYYMWGETVTRYECWWTNYSLYRGGNTAYLDTDKFYTPYSNISGTSYDAARAKMGGNWRMPTRSELNTLVYNCEFKTGERNGGSGYIVTGPSGKSIFLPNTGIQRHEENQFVNSVNLWSSTTSGKSEAYYLNGNQVTTYRKFYGLPIRAVVDIK